MDDELEGCRVAASFMTSDDDIDRLAWQLYEDEQDNQSIRNDLLEESYEEQAMMKFKVGDKVITIYYGPGTVVDTLSTNLLIDKPEYANDVIKIKIDNSDNLKKPYYMWCDNNGRTNHTFDYPEVFLADSIIGQALINGDY